MEEQIKTAPQTDVEVVDIQFRSGQKIYFFDPDGQRFADGDHIIIDTARGEEFGICVGGNHKIPPKNVVAPCGRCFAGPPLRTKKRYRRTGRRKSAPSRSASRKSRSMGWTCSW